MAQTGEYIVLCVVRNTVFIKKIDFKIRRYLLCLTVHIEGDGGAATQVTGLVVGLGRVDPAALQQVVGQTLS